MQTYYTLEGIVLSTTPYKDSTTFLTVFSKEAGKVSLIVKGKKHRTLSTPLCHAEFVVHKTKFGDIVSDSTLISLQLHLRDSYEKIDAALTLASLVNSTQLHEKASPALFTLFTRSLENLRTVSAPHITGCFLAKLLRHEGHLSKESPECPLTTDEWALATALAEVTRFSLLNELKCPKDLVEKLKKWALRMRHI